MTTTEKGHDAVTEPPGPAVVAPRPLSGGPRPGSIGMPVERSKDFGATTRRLIQMMRPERAGVIASLILSLCGVGAMVVGPKILGHATDVIVRGLRHRPVTIDLPSLHRVLSVAVAIYVAGFLCNWLQSVLLAGIVQRTMRRLRRDVEAKLNTLPLAHVDRQARGDLLSRVTNDIDNIAQSLQQTLSQLVSQLLTLFGTLAVMFVISWELALIATVTVPLSMLAMRTVTKRSKKRFVAQWAQTGALNAQVEEAFTGHAVVKAFGRQRQVEERFRTTNDSLYESSFAAQFLSGVIQPAMLVVGNINFIAIAVIGGLRIASGSMSVGDVQAFIQYSRQFSMPLTYIASMVNMLQSGIASAERVFELLDAEEQTPDAPATAAEPVRGRVEFDDVTFSYDPDRELITGLSLVAEPGQTIAIVGPTGAGKTTLVNLLMRFYELDGGRITLDGRDIAEMPRPELRSSFGMVLQDTWLFGGTIRDNIAYGKLDASEAEVIEAAKATYVDRFVHSLPDGYDTMIEGEGGNLSAGEKQLLTIARAFLADPAILILDEATSSVDTRTEVLIQHAMAALRAQRTSFVIAHRLSTIRDADTILVMDGGRIVEQGDHDGLLAAGGAYAALYMAQFAGPADDLEATTTT
jgi:ATP-binding cassette subfamily B multidrug efflux pump